MIIKQTTKQFDRVGAPINSSNMTIDDQGLEFIFKAFSDTLYSDKIGSIVREITSNAYDSHQEAGVKQPVIIRLKTPSYNENGDGSITIEDFGVGISPDRMENIFRKYFSSTKRGTNNEIGGFGIGSKTPLSYAKTFTIITRYDGVEYIYLIHRGEKTPIVDLLEQQNTDKENGTQVVVPIKNQYDFHKFKDAIRTQLKYFDQVIVDHPEFDNFNTRKIIKGKHFIFTQNDNSSNSGICLGKVSYPINFKQIDEEQYMFITPISLLFDVGDIDVTLNREAIDYNDRVIETIKKKLALARQEIGEIHDKKKKGYDDFFEFLENRGDTHTMEIGGEKVDVRGYLEVEDKTYYIPFKDTPIKVPYTPFFPFKVSSLISNGKTTKTNDWDFSNYLKKNLPIYRLSGSYSKRKNLYLNDAVGSFYVVRQRSPEEFDYESALSLHGEADQEKYIKLYYKEVLKALISKTESYDKIEIDEDWLEEYKQDLKAGRGSRKVLSKIILHIYCNSGSFRQYETEIPALEKFFNKKGRYIVYGGKDDEFNIRKLHAYLFGTGQLFEPYYIHGLKYSDPNYKTQNTPFLVCKISQENIKNIKNHPMFIHIDDFIKEKSKMFIRSIVKRKLSTEYYGYMSDKYYNFISSEWKEKADFITGNYHHNHSDAWLQSLAEKHKWDTENVGFKGQFLPEIEEWIPKYLEAIEPLRLLDLRMFEEFKTKKETASIIKRFLKITNPKNYYDVQKNICRP